MNRTPRTNEELLRMAAVQKKERLTKLVQSFSNDMSPPPEERRASPRTMVDAIKEHPIACAASLVAGGFIIHKVISRFSPQITEEAAKWARQLKEETTQQVGARLKEAIIPLGINLLNKGIEAYVRHKETEESATKQPPETTTIYPH